MEEESKRLLEEIKTPTVREIAQQTFYDGVIGDHPVTIVQSGIGKVNATIATALLIQEFNVEAVINTGSAGGIGQDLNIGDLVVAHDLSYHDADSRSFGYTYGQIPQMEARFLSDEFLLEKIKEAANIQKWPVKEGLILTGDSFISDAAQIHTIKNFFPEALVLEMEGAAVGQTCFQFGVPFAVIRAVSDTADAEANVDFDEFVLQAGKKSADLVLALIQKIADETK